MSERFITQESTRGKSKLSVWGEQHQLNLLRHAHTVSICRKIYNRWCPNHTDWKQPIQDSIGNCPLGDFPMFLSLFLSTERTQEGWGMELESLENFYKVAYFSWNNWEVVGKAFYMNDILMWGSHFHWWLGVSHLSALTSPSGRGEPGAETQPLYQQGESKHPHKSHRQAAFPESVFSLMWKWWGRSNNKKSMPHPKATGIPTTHRLSPNHKLTANMAFKEWKHLNRNIILEII